MTTTSRRRDREVAHVREDVLRAAGRAFATRGLQDATIHDIAKEAGYTTTSLYAYFKGKQDIVQGLVDVLGAELQRTFDEPTPPGLTFAQRLGLLLRRQFEFGERWREAFPILFVLKAGGGQPSGRGRGRLRIPEPEIYVRLLTTWMRANAKPEDIGGLEPEDAACVLKAILAAMFQRWSRRGQQRGPGDLADLVPRLFFHGVKGLPFT